MASANQHRTLRVVALEAPPLCFVGPDGSAEGLLVHVVEEALQRAGFQVQTDILPWQRCLELTQTGEADAIFYAGYSPERAEHFYYPAGVLYHERPVLWRRSGSNATLLTDFSNARRFTIGAGLGFQYGGRLDRALKEGLFKHVERLSSWERSALMLLNGRLDFILGFHIPTQYLLREEGLEQRIEPLCDEQGEIIVWSRSPTYLAFSRKSMTLEEVRAFDAALDKMKQDGTYEALLYPQE